MMNREKILQQAKDELERHVWGTFVEGKASVALGGTGVVFPVAKPAANDSERTVNTCGILLTTFARYSNAGV